MTDSRLTEIRARVAKCNEQHTNGYAGCSLCDLEYALEEIERLACLIEAIEASCAQAAKDAVQFQDERDRLRTAHLQIVQDYWRVVNIARAATEENQQAWHTPACLVKQSGGWPCTCGAALEDGK